MNLLRLKKRFQKIIKKGAKMGPMTAGTANSATCSRGATAAMASRPRMARASASGLAARADLQTVWATALLRLRIRRTKPEDKKKSRKLKVRENSRTLDPRELETTREISRKLEQA